MVLPLNIEAGTIGVWIFQSFGKPGSPVQSFVQAFIQAPVGRLSKTLSLRLCRRGLIPLDRTVKKQLGTYSLGQVGKAKTFPNFVTSPKAGSEKPLVSPDPLLGDEACDIQLDACAHG